VNNFFFTSNKNVADRNPDFLPLCFIINRTNATKVMKERKKVAHKKLLNGHDPHFEMLISSVKSKYKQKWGLKVFFFSLFCFCFMGGLQTRSEVNEGAWKADIKNEQQKEHL